MNSLRHHCALIALASLCLAAAPPAALAQWNYNPFTGGSQWLGFSRLFSYPLNRYSSTAMPFYLLNPLVRHGTYYAGQGLTNGGRQYNYGNYNADDQLQDPRQRTRPMVSDGNGVNDQIVHAQPFRQEAPPVAGATAGDPTVPPPLAPTFPQKSAPLAAGFIEVVNTRFQGDISRALFDPETRSYARSIGLIDSDAMFDSDLGPQKIQTIRNILADEREDATVRINAVRMLLKH